MAKKKLKYTDILPLLSEQTVIISVIRKSTGTSCLFSSYEECLNYLANTNNEIVPKDTVYGFQPRTAISMLMASVKFNKEFTVTIAEVKYTNK